MRVPKLSLQTMLSKVKTELARHLPSFLPMIESDVITENVRIRQDVPVFTFFSFFTVSVNLGVLN